MISMYQNFYLCAQWFSAIWMSSPAPSRMEVSSSTLVEGPTILCMIPKSSSLVRDGGEDGDTFGLSILENCILEFEVLSFSAGRTNLCSWFCPRSGMKLPSLVALNGELYVVINEAFVRGIPRPRVRSGCISMSSVDCLHGVLCKDNETLEGRQWVAVRIFAGHRKRSQAKSSTLSTLIHRCGVNVTVYAHQTLRRIFNVDSYMRNVQFSVNCTVGKDIYLQ